MQVVLLDIVQVPAKSSVAARLRWFVTTALFVTVAFPDELTLNAAVL